MESNGKAETFLGAKNLATFFYTYLNAVAQVIGMEQAIALNTHVSEKMGVAQGQAIKDQTGLEEVDLARATTMVYAIIKQGRGISSEVMEESTESFVSKIGHCPIYEAAQTVVMKNELIETECRANAICYMDAIVKQWNSNFNYQLREFRLSD